MQPQNPNNDQMLEHILENGDTNAKHTHSLLENNLEASSNHTNQVVPLMENQLEMQDKTMKSIDENGSKVAEAISSMKPAMDAANFIANFMQAIKGDKGDKGDTPVVGKDFYTPEEIANVVKEITDSISVPEDGITPVKGQDYFTQEEIQSIVDEVFSLVPTPKDGNDGMDGKDATVDYEMIISEVLAKLPKGKSVKQVVQTPITGEEILKKIKGVLSYNDLKDLPTIFKEKMAGTGYLKDITDVSLTNLQNADTLKWNAVTNKWENGVGGSAVGAFTDLTDVPASYTGQGGKVVAVKADVSGLEFIAATSTDEKVKYDANDASAGYLGAKTKAGTGISLAEGTGGDADKLVITNSAPDQTVAITGAGISVVTGTYPNFTVTSTEVAPEGTAIKSTGETGGTKFLREDGDGTSSWQTVPGGNLGDVVGPASAVDSNFASFNTTTGKLIKDSGSKAADFYASNNPSGFTSNTGTVTSVSVTTANGVSGTVATDTTTPAITLALGAITPSSVTTGSVAANGSGGLLLKNVGGTTVMNVGVGGGAVVDVTGAGSYSSYLRVGGSAHGDSVFESKATTTDGSTGIVHGYNSSGTEVFALNSDGDIDIVGDITLSAGKKLTGTTQFAIDTNRQGFLNTTQTSISFSGTTFTLTDAGAGWSYYRSGIKYTISGNKTVALSAATAGIYYIYIDATDGTLTCSAVNGAWTLLDTKLPVATVTYNSTLTPTYWLADERHTALIDQRMEYYLHASTATKMVSTPTLSGYTLNSDVNANKTFAISAATLLDQDLKIDVASLTQPNGTATDYSVWYRTSATTWAWKASNMPFAYNIGNTNDIIQYDNGGTMTDGTVGSARWINSYLLVSNKQGVARHIIIPGRGNFTTLAAAQAEAVSAFTWTGFEVDEAVIAYRLTWALLTGTYTSNGKCRLAATPQLINISSTTNASSGAGTDHNTLSNLQGGQTSEYYHLNAAEYTGLSGLTASEIAITDASGNLASAAVATYPSLTELSYVKGVTSALQTQINAKGAGTVTAIGVTTANGVSGTSSGGATPSLTIALGAITPTSINGLGVTVGNPSVTTNVAIGTSPLNGTLTGGTNVAIGYHSLQGVTNGNDNVGIGTNAGLGNSQGSQNVAVGRDALYTNISGNQNVAIGFSAGKYETGSNAFYIDNQDRTNTAGDKAGALLYGTFNATPASQTLKVNGTLGVSTLTASEMVITDASKNLVSAAVATYPSLTELSYVKGVTSAIQTQLNAKGAGTVTAVSVATANGVSGSSSGGATPALTITLGAITPSTVTASAGISTGANGGSLGSIKLYGNTSGDVTLFPNSIAGTGIQITFPATTGTVALTSSNITGSAATLTTTRTIWGQNFNGSANVTGDLALGASSLTLTGSIGATGARATKLWATDIESTNMPTVGGTSLSSTFAGLGANTFTGLQTLATGTTVLAPLKFVAGTSLTTPVAGVVEFDGTDFFISV